jgi:levanbiose-producing levanase
MMLGIMSIIVSTWMGVASIYAADWNTNLSGDKALSGTWTKVAGDGLSGVRGVGANDFDMTSSDVEMNFVFEADVKVDTSSPYGVGSLVFRSSADGNKSYVVPL